MLTLTFGRLLHKAGELQKMGWDKEKRKTYLSGLINGAENWQLPVKERK